MPSSDLNAMVTPPSSERVLRAFAMAPSLNVPLLTAGMLTTGVCMSLWSKYQDMQCVENCDDPNAHNRIFYEQPVWQTLQMFCGEMLCFIPVAYASLVSLLQPPIQLPTDSEDDMAEPLKPSGKRLHGWRILLLCLPTCCDLAGTTLINVGLLFTPVSIFQMTRGALVLFVGVFSVIFLRRRLRLYQWFALVTVMTGVCVVGLSGLLAEKKMKEDGLLGRAITFLAEPDAGPNETQQATKVLTGVLFILCAQIFTATQFVIEEKIMARYSVEPLMVVGLEGLFGALIIMILFPILSLPSVSSKTPYFDLPRGWHQMIGNSRVMLSGVIIAFSIGGFNFFGMSVTRRVNATARSVTDACRTLAIWIVSLGLGWEKLLWPVSVVQVAGFSLLIYGTFLFNNLVRSPPCIPQPASAQASSSPTAVRSAEVQDETETLSV